MSKKNNFDNKIEKNDASIDKKNEKLDISPKLNTLKEKRFSSMNSSFLNGNKKRPFDSVDDSPKKSNKFMKKMPIENDDSDDDLDTLITSEELFQRLTSEDDDDKSNIRLFKSKKSDKILKQKDKQEHKKNAFDLMKKEKHQEISKKMSLKKENKKDNNSKMTNLQSNKKIDSSKKIDKLKKKSLNNAINKTTKDNSKNKIKPKVSQKVTNKTIAKIKNKNIINKNSMKASLQTILTFSKQTEPSKNNSSNEKTKKSIGDNDLDELFNDINYMNAIVEHQKSISDRCNMIQKSLEESENNRELFHSKHYTNNDKYKTDSTSDKIDFKEEEPFTKKLKKWNQQKKQQAIKEDNKEASSHQDDDKNNKYNEQFNMFKQMVKEFENEEFDEESFKFDINSLDFLEKPKSRITLDAYIKSGRLLSLKKKNIINNSYNSQNDKATFKCPYCQYEYYDEIEKSVFNAIQTFLETNHMKKDGKIITLNVPLIKQVINKYTT